jgi:sugar (pentulose or hexulose) kinase
MMKQGYLGIDVGTQGLSVILTDDTVRIPAASRPRADGPLRNP